MGRHVRRVIAAYCDLVCGEAVTGPAQLQDAVIGPAQCGDVVYCKNGVIMSSKLVKGPLFTMFSRAALEVVGLITMAEAV